MHLRPRQLGELATRVFDTLVIGGGITGAGIARDAALRGLSVALVDKGDFANGTSSRSSRLVHGGVRYLEHGHLRLVFEASTERRRLLELAPHLVRPLAFVWPVYRGQRLPLWKLRAGLTLYDMLSLFRNVERHEHLTKEEVLVHEPALSPQQLRGGVRYFDAATDDARLTLVNVLDAVRLGAVVANHVVYTGGVTGADTLHAARMEDTLTGNRFDVRARVVVNAAGPWSDAVAQLGGAGRASQVRGSKGAHIAVPRSRIGNQQAVTLVHPGDGRVMFTLPAGSHAIIGTTDTFTDASPDQVRASEADVRYLLEAANALFPEARLTRDDVVAAWAGIRPLVPSTGSSVAASREHAIDRSGNTVTVTGGKLTTYRVMAGQVVDVVRQALRMPSARSRTAQRPLPGADVYAHQLAAADQATTPEERFNAHLLRTYGSDARLVQQYCASGMAAREIVAGLPYRMGEVRWAAEREFACTLGDILIRRTHVAFETRDNGRAAARLVADFAAPLLGWDAGDAALRERELARYDAEVERMFGVDR